jgi:hypothetical protein
MSPIHINSKNISFSFILFLNYITYITSVGECQRIMKWKRNTKRSRGLFNLFFQHVERIRKIVNISVRMTFFCAENRVLYLANINRSVSFSAVTIGNKTVNYILLKIVISLSLSPQSLGNVVMHIHFSITSS